MTGQAGPHSAAADAADAAAGEAGPCRTPYLLSTCVLGLQRRRITSKELLSRGKHGAPPQRTLTCWFDGSGCLWVNERRGISGYRGLRARGGGGGALSGHIITVSGTASRVHEHARACTHAHTDACTSV